MAFTKEEKRDLRAKRKREREADEALRGAKRQPRGRPRYGCKWEEIAGKWIDNSVYAALVQGGVCLLYTSPSPRDGLLSRMPSSA